MQALPRGAEAPVSWAGYGEASEVVGVPAECTPWGEVSALLPRSCVRL